MTDCRLQTMCGFCATKAAHKTQANEHGYLWYPDCLRPLRGDDELTYGEWMAALSAAGVNLVSVRLTGSNVRHNSGACGFEPPPAGTFNIWHSVLSPDDLDLYRSDQVPPLDSLTLEFSNLQQLIEAAESHNVKLWFTLFEFKEFTSRWPYHAWNRNNQYTNRQDCEEQDRGFLDRACDFLTDARAIEAAKARIQFVLDTFGQSTAIAVWQIFDEMTYLIADEWFDVEWSGVRDKVRNDMVPWVAEMARYIRANDPHMRHIANSHAMAPKTDIWPGPDEYASYINEIFDAPEIDVVACRAYFGGDLARAKRELDMLQERWPDKILVIGEYWPFAHGEEPVSEPAPFETSKLHQWLNICTTPHAWAAMRWPGIEESVVNVWETGGYADPQLHEIAGVTRAYAELVAEYDWNTATSLDSCPVSAKDASLVASCGDGTHVKALILWDELPSRRLTFWRLKDGEYTLYLYDYLVGAQTTSTRMQVLNGIITVDLPEQKMVTVLYLEKQEQGPPEPPIPPVSFLARIEFVDPALPLPTLPIVRIYPIEEE